MLEKEPIYIKELRESLGNDIKDLKHHMDKKFHEVDDKLNEVHEKLDIHFETIGEVKVQVTGIAMLLKRKADEKDLRSIEKRTERLEGKVFA